MAAEPTAANPAPGRAAAKPKTPPAGGRPRWVGSERPVGSWRQQIKELLAISEPETPELLRRIELMERDLVLPLKAAGIAMLLHSFYFTPWFGRVIGALEIAVESTQYFLWIYIAVNGVIAGLLLAMRRLRLSVLTYVVFASILMDGIFLAALALVTGGYDSIVYWLFLGLIMRSAVSVPRGTSQLLLNLTIIACYVLSGIVDLAIAELAEDLDEEAKIALGLTGPLPTEPLVVRLLLLFLITICSYGVQVLLERQRRAQEEAREFALREGQLQSAGRLAAEFAHQMKNPLAIINNAAFSLQRALQRGQTDVSEQVQIIQEEVVRSDRIITDIMGYAQLSEGRVEKLHIEEELVAAVARVFPPGAGYPIQVHTDWSGVFPPLMMLRRHLSEALINVLQNAREALEGREGHVYVSARCLEDRSIEVRIRDNGPGIPADRLEKIFEPYYSSKPKGTGLGLATVKHNVELYGGSVRVESELGKGACFILLFPAKTELRLKIE